MAKTVKLADIAKAMGVSVVTVSNALSDKKGVSEETREKIKGLALQMGYQYSKEIPSVKNIASYNIGIVVSERYLGKFTSFYWELYQCVARQASKAGSFTMMAVLELEDEKLLEPPRLLIENKVDGCIVLGKLDKEYTKMLREQIKMPMIFLDFYDEDIDCDAIVSDSFYGMYQMTNYLFDMGHTKIAFVGTILATDSITDRYFGYAKSLLEHGITEKPEWIIEDRDISTGDIKISLPKEMPTAFVCNCDLTASQLIQLLKSEGYKVPDDVSVVGFDGFLYQNILDFGLTTYEVDMEVMASISINVLFKKIRNESVRTGIRIVEGKIVVRDSVKKINIS